ncbi:MAG: tRNA epoxyqueuosine(34) reductase QueG [Anaerolineae bacterium]
MSVLSAERIQARALDLGFNLVGIARAEPSPRLETYLNWIARGYHGTMGYLARDDRLARRRDLNLILPRVQSLIMVGMDYHALNLSESALRDPARGRIAAYAWGVDYHDLLTARLNELSAWIGQASDSNQRVYVDTGAILERSHAQQAGLGFVGKNTMLIHPKRGSYFFLGEILTTALVDHYDVPHRETQCGRCTRCLAACPTNAFPAPYVLDARRCISYLTIEYKGVIPRELRPFMGNWVMGCDVCQEACPFNRFVHPTGQESFKPPDLNRAAPPLLDLLRLNDTSFTQMFGDSPVSRLKRERLVRNACVAAGNWAHPSALEGLLPLLEDASPLIRAHAAWAIQEIGGMDAALAALRRHEIDPMVLAELE